MNFKKAIIHCTIFLSFVLNNFSYSFAETATEMETTTIQETQQTQQTQTNNNTSAPTIIAESAILIDADTGIVLYEKDADSKRYPASITKILTTLLTIENCKLDDKIKHSHNAIFGIGPGSSHIGMRENEEITVEQAIYGIMLASANEVCMAVAEHIGGSVENFMKIANNRLKEIGAKNTHFANPHGFHDDNHYTTARDMALIMKEAIKNETFVKVINTYSYTIPPTNIVNEPRYLHNSNKFINPYNNFYYEYCVGGKTGFTDQAGNTLVTYCKKDDMNLISVVLKDQGTNTYVDSKKLMEYGFTLFEEKKLFDKESYTGITNTIQTFHDQTIDLGKISVVPADDFTSFVPKNIDTSKITTKINLPEQVDGPVKIGDKVGSLDVIYTDDNNSQTLGQVDLVSNTKIDLIPEETLQDEENMKKFIDNTLNILLIAAIVVGVAVVLSLLVYFIRKYIRNKNKNKISFK